MEAFEIGDDVYDERKDAVMKVIAVHDNIVTCEWRTESGGKLLYGDFDQLSIRKISIEGGKSSSTDGVIDKDLADD